MHTDRTHGTFRRILRRYWRRDLRDVGQSGLAMAVGLSTVLATGGAILATGVIEHDPLVQADVVQHYAYRALEAGVNTYLANINANPNLINCRYNSASGGQCNPSEYDTWDQVGGTGNGSVPEWYMWESPTFCFNVSCSATSGTGTLLYVKAEIWGAAGYSGHVSYQSSDLNLTPENGFLTGIWWSDYEATDPVSEGYSPGSSYCTWDWENSPNLHPTEGPVVTLSHTPYTGPNFPSTGVTGCSPVYFGPNDQVYGPIFSNDSIYVSGDPKLGPVTTADPNYLFCTGTSVSDCGTTNGNNTIVNQAGNTTGNSYGSHNFENLPQTDSALQTYANLDGCDYQGPTTIELNANDTMNIWSPDSYLAGSTTAATCLPSTNGGVVNVPNGANGNGVIYVKSAPISSGCEGANGTTPTGYNPFDDWTNGTYGSSAQLNYDGSYTNFFGAQPQPDCEGDAFVSDNPTSGGISGALTIATANNVVITGNLEYTHCGGGYQPTSPYSFPCSYNASGANDVLGLIATNYVEVNHPVQPNCTTSGGRHPVTTCSALTSNTAHYQLEPACTSSQLGTPAAALCDPAPVVIDAAILALNHSFAVNNEGLIDSANGASFGVGAAEGQLTVYGAIDQSWRGTVDEFSGASVTSGYSKYYDWDSRIQAVTPPYYLTPGTASFALSSSAVTIESTGPECPPSSGVVCPVP